MWDKMLLVTLITVFFPWSILAMLWFLGWNETVRIFRVIVIETVGLTAFLVVATIMLLLVVSIFVLMADKGNTESPESTKFQSIIPKQSQYARPSTAPNGHPWPVSAGYVSGYPRIHTNGLSRVAVNNSENNFDVFVKLVSLDTPAPLPVQVFFIPASSQFTLNKVTPGRYDIRYKNLENGKIFRSEPFNLEQNEDSNDAQFSHATVTLHKVESESVQTYELSEAQF